MLSCIVPGREAVNTVFKVFATASLPIPKRTTTNDNVMTVLCLPILLDLWRLTKQETESITNYVWKNIFLKIGLLTSLNIFEINRTLL